MTVNLTISTRAIGRRKRLLDDWSTPIPPHISDDGEPLTLRRLLTWLVCEEVRRFNQRQADRISVQVLSPQQIDEGRRVGKIDSKGQSEGTQVDPDEAVGVALEAFEDGLYLVIIDDEEYRSLDEQVFVNPDSRITLLRLIMLAGG